MLERRRRQLIFHGAVAFFVSLVCGLRYAEGITVGWSEATVRAWQLAHVGLAAGAVAIFAVAAILHHLVLADRALAVLVWSFVVSIYTFMAAVFVSGTWGGRGLEPSGPFSNQLVFVGYTVFAVATFVGAGLLLAGSYRAVRQAR